MLKNIWFALIVLLVLSGCSSINLTSNKEPSYSQKLDRVLIASNLKATFYGKDFETVSSILSENLNNRNITTSTLDYGSPASPDTNAIKDAVATFRPNQMLEILLTKYTYQHIGNSTANYYDLKLNLIDLPSNRTVWRSAVNIMNGTPIAPLKINGLDLSNKIVGALELDGLLAPKAVEQKDGNASAAMK